MFYCDLLTIFGFDVGAQRALTGAVDALLVSCCGDDIAAASSSSSRDDDAPLSGGVWPTRVGPVPMQDTTNPCRRPIPVHDVGSLSVAAFKAGHFRKDLPVALKGMASAWDAVTSWNCVAGMRSLARTYWYRTVPIEIRNTRTHGEDTTDNVLHERLCTMGDLINTHLLHYFLM